MLARQIMIELGKIASEEEFPYLLEEFTSKIVPVYRQDQRGQNQRRPDQRRPNQRRPNQRR